VLRSHCEFSRKETAAALPTKSSQFVVGAAYAARGAKAMRAVDSDEARILKTKTRENENKETMKTQKPRGKRTKETQKEIRRQINPFERKAN
jgi:hypothetical protein